MRLLSGTKRSMALLLPLSIKRKESKRGNLIESDLPEIQVSFYRGIGISIKGAFLPKGFNLWKVYSTTDEGARRILFARHIPSGDGFFLMYRSKNDPIGANMTIRNPTFKKELKQYVSLMIQDMETNNLEVLSNDDTDSPH